MTQYFSKKTFGGPRGMSSQDESVSYSQDNRQQSMCMPERMMMAPVARVSIVIIC